LCYGLLLLNLWLQVVHGMLLLVLLLLRVLPLLLLGVLLVLLLLLLGILLLMVLDRHLTGIHGLTMGLLGVHGRLIPIVLGVDGHLGTQNLHGAVVSSDGDHVLAMRAAVLGVFEPTCQTRHASQADAEEAEDGTNEAAIVIINMNCSLQLVDGMGRLTSAWKCLLASPSSSLGDGRKDSQSIAAGRPAGSTE
jgi:hypothetical protein